MRSHAGAASAPHMPIRNDVVSSEVVPANPADTAAANATEIVTAKVCVTIRSRRGSTTSVSAPAGKVRRKSGKVVATWTAETSLGLGLRLVIIQAEPVSNIANPTLESDVAMRMTMNAGLLSRPEGGSALDGAFGSRFSSVVKSSARHPDAVRHLAFACPHYANLASAPVRATCAYRCSLKNAPACASARRPGSSCAFQSGHAWIICGQISRVAETSASPAGGAKRVTR